MFNRYGKKPQPGSSKPLKDLTAILAPEQLLTQGKRPSLLSRIQTLSTFEYGRFEQDCQALINNLLNYVQQLPETSNSYYSQAGGLIDHALNRTEAALEIFREFLLQDGERLSEEQQLWLYALLTAGLLQGIGKLQVDFSVLLFDINGQQIKAWNPLLETLAASCAYYHYEFETEQDETFRKRLNLLLARLLMPASGFVKIAANKDVLAVWLSLLNEDFESAGTLGTILDRADAIAIDRYFKEFLQRHATSRGARAGRISTFVDTNPLGLEKDMLIGAEFLDWLQLALGNGQIMINKAPLFSVPGGLLMSVEIFKLFVREHPEYKNWQAIQKGFLALGLHKIGAEGNPISRFEQSNTQQMVSGIVLSKFGVVLPNEVSVHNLKTGAQTKLSSLDCIHQTRVDKTFIGQSESSKLEGLAHLNHHGEWQSIEANAPGLTNNPGTNIRG